MRLFAVAVLVGLRMFDPTGAVHTRITSADIVRASVRADTSPATGQPIVTASFTEAGTSKFCTLTRALARRGARLHRFQHFAIAVGGHVYARPYIDYRASPRGLCGSPSFEIEVRTRATARRLVRALRGG